jgi:hypothetical protein
VFSLSLQFFIYFYFYCGVAWFSQFRGRRAGIMRRQACGFALSDTPNCEKIEKAWIHPP